MVGGGGGGERRDRRESRISDQADGGYPAFTFVNLHICYKFAGCFQLTPVEGRHPLCSGRQLDGTPSLNQAAWQPLALLHAFVTLCSKKTACCLQRGVEGDPDPKRWF